MSKPVTGAGMSPANKQTRTKKIATLNDHFRRVPKLEDTYVSMAIVKRGTKFLETALKQIGDTKQPLAPDDTNEERSMGAASVDGVNLEWSIDYFDLDEDDDSPDPADSSVTVRTLTVWPA